MKVEIIIDNKQGSSELGLTGNSHSHWDLHMSTLPRAYTIVKYIIAIVVVGALGFFSAKQVAAYLHGKEVEKALQEKRQYRREFTQGVLKSMNSLQIGDVLPDYQFEDLAHNPLTLSDLTTENTLLVFFDPACESCDDELTAINEAITDSLEYRRFLFISSGDSVMVAEKVESLALRNPLLYDRSGDYFYQLGIFSYPFNVIINKDRVIKDMIVGTLDHMDLVGYIDKGKLE